MKFTKIRKIFIKFSLFLTTALLLASCSSGNSKIPKNVSYSSEEKTVEAEVKTPAKKTTSTCNVKIINKTESKINTIIFTEKDKKSVFNTVSILTGENQIFEFKKGVPYKVELIDEKNHRYCKTISNNGKNDSYLCFETDLIEIEYYDRDFIPRNLSDLILKFFWL